MVNMIVPLRVTRYLRVLNMSAWSIWRRC